MNTVSDRKTFTVELEQETDGRWLAEVLELPGVLAYGSSSDEARARVEALALRVLAERREEGDIAPQLEDLFIAT